MLPCTRVLCLAALCSPRAPPPPIPAQACAKYLRAIPGIVATIRPPPLPAPVGKGAAPLPYVKLPWSKQSIPCPEVRCAAHGGTRWLGGLVARRPGDPGASLRSCSRVASGTAPCGVVHLSKHAPPVCGADAWPWTSPLQRPPVGTHLAPPVAVCRPWAPAGVPAVAAILSCTVQRTGASVGGCDPVPPPPFTHTPSHGTFCRREGWGGGWAWPMNAWGLRCGLFVRCSVVRCSQRADWRAKHKAQCKKDGGAYAAGKA
jgi:hypothetical protein